MGQRELSESKKKLFSLEKEGIYVFHGSPTADILKLEPRQAHTIPEGEQYKVPDGEPGIAATPYAEIAIFRGLIRRGRSGFSLDKGEPSFKATQKALRRAHDISGFVYVLRREEFSPKNGHISDMDWRSTTSVKPLMIIPVTYRDLPDIIKIIPDDK